MASEISSEQAAQISDLHERVVDPDLLGARIDTIQETVVMPLAHRAVGFNDFQREALHKLRANLAADQTVDNPTRTGKSFLLRQMAAQACAVGLNVAIVSHRRHILSEHQTELALMGVESGRPVMGQALRGGVNLISTQTVTRNQRVDVIAKDQFDLVLIDEVHRALGEKTIEGMRSLFPNAVRMSFTATPDFSEDRSVTDEYGEKIVSRSLVEAIEKHLASPVRAFLYRTDAVIDLLDPNVADFTPRELKRLADFVARNHTIADAAHDLVSDGRQGLIATIPGENLLHADTLRDLLIQRQVEAADGTLRSITAHVVRGSDPDLKERLRDFEDGAIDILLFCDVLTEGYTTHKASFLINGRPTTSIVNLTQQVGRVLQPKGREAVVIDFLDRSMSKMQRTIYDVLELDRSVQGVYMKPGSTTGEPTEGERDSADSYMRGLFRPSLVAAFERYDNILLEDLYYQAKVLAPYERRLANFRRNREREFNRELRKWGKLLTKEGLVEEPIDFFMVNGQKPPQDDEGPFTEIPRKGPRSSEQAWVGFEHLPAYVPPLTVNPLELEDLYAKAPLSLEAQDPAELIARSAVLARGAIRAALTELTDREREILEIRFGLVDGRSKTLEEVGQHFGVTRELIRMREAKALAILRHPKRHNHLRNLLEIRDEMIEGELSFITEFPTAGQHGKPGTQMSRADIDAKIAQNREFIAYRDAYHKTLFQSNIVGTAETIGRKIGERFIEHIALATGVDKYDFRGYRKTLKDVLSLQTANVLRGITYGIKETVNKDHRSFWVVNDSQKIDEAIANNSNVKEIIKALQSRQRTQKRRK